MKTPLRALLIVAGSVLLLPYLLDTARLVYYLGQLVVGIYRWSGSL